MAALAFIIFKENTLCNESCNGFSHYVTMKPLPRNVLALTHSNCCQWEYFTCVVCFTVLKDLKIKKKQYIYITLSSDITCQVEFKLIK